MGPSLSVGHSKADTASVARVLYLPRRAGECLRDLVNRDFGPAIERIEDEIGLEAFRYGLTRYIGAHRVSTAATL
jgi:hypothetical protein